MPGIILQSFFAGLAASGALTSALRLMTKAAFDKTNHGLRKGVSMFHSFNLCTLITFNLSCKFVFLPQGFFQYVDLSMEKSSFSWLWQGEL